MCSTCGARTASHDYASLELTHDEYLLSAPAEPRRAEGCLARPPAPSAEELEAAEAEAGAGGGGVRAGILG